MGTREAVRARIQELWDYPKFGVPFERGGRWFQSRNSGLQNQSVLYVGTSVSDEGRVLLDPNTLSIDGTAALTHLSVSPDGSLAAYAVSDSGSDWMTWRVLHVHSGEQLDDVIRWSKFSLAAWRHDLSGFYYSALDEPTADGAYRDESRHLRLFFHPLGREQADDDVVFEAPDHPDWLPRAEVSDDDRYLIVTVDQGTGPENMLLVRDLHDGTEGYREVAGDFARKVLFMGNEGSRLLLLTDDGAERGKVVATDLDAAGRTVDRRCARDRGHVARSSGVRRPARLSLPPPRPFHSPGVRNDGRAGWRRPHAGTGIARRRSVGSRFLRGPPHERCHPLPGGVVCGVRLAVVA